MKKIHPHSAPSLVPHVVLDVHADGTLIASVDGVPLDPPPAAGPWRRSSLGQIIDLATGGRTAPVRVEVHETDDTVFTEFITPSSRRRNAALEPATPVEEMLETHPPAFVTIEETGFLPAEDVAVAVIVRHAEADPSGMARALLDSARLGAGEVVLLGRVSGTLVIRKIR
ncbi:hypothetical protein [Sinomonas terrae]|uniref:Uncharacterized protein n=1 Tax=Sinomonas terrae TaxID=2908838 RepID=A0ABS9U256_9MICC|nr:hypothetical protein [Sinomonas terrae]MCH6470782.1 hypothetical protein [Sinomonas terrae]